MDPARITSSPSVVRYSKEFEKEMRERAIFLEPEIIHEMIEQEARIYYDMMKDGIV
ncbi:hypothetical protein QCA50_011744 [Cerrena zonata]|uniref:Uncharacterized protein n=1 Tax=Cerrena zonata TaxID=2478898 RepID=A0AAW0G7D6_9APHY